MCDDVRSLADRAQMLFDRALLKRGQDEIRSNYITYNAQTELFKADTRQPSAPIAGEPPSAARVHGVLQPSSKEAGKAAPAAPDPAPVTLKSAPALAPQ